MSMYKQAAPPSSSSSRQEKPVAFITVCWTLYALLFVEPEHRLVYFFYAIYPIQ